MRTLPTVTAAAIGLLVAACGAPEQLLDDPAGEAHQEQDDPGTDGSTNGADEADEPAADDTTTLDLGDPCDNPQDGYRISYPDAWNTNDGEVTAPCRVFDVEVPQIEPDTVLPLASSVLITVEDRGFDEMRALIDDDPATEVHDVVEAEIDGREALRVDGVATGETYLADGVEVHRTYVAFGERTLVAHSNDLGEPDLDRRRDLIAEMLASLEAIDRTDEPTDGTADGSEEAGEQTSEAPAEEATPPIAEASREPRSGGDGSGYLVDVRLGHHDGFSRLVLEFEASVPEFEVAPTEGPIYAHPSGEDLELGGTSYLEVITSGTSVDLTGDEATRTYDGPDRLSGDGDPIVEVALSGDHHGVMSWVLGLSAETEFAVAELEDPARIVIDVMDE